MLYATTRGKHDVVTAYKVVHTDCYTDGGLFVPFRMPQYSVERRNALLSEPPAQIIADILNTFFGCSLSSWDVEYALGRKPLKMSSLGRSLVAVELWHNAGSDISWMVRRLSDRIHGSDKSVKPTNWMHIAVRIALLFASFGSIPSNGSIPARQRVDIVVTSGDFSMPMAAWYARQMGLPIGNIICGCNANGGLWDLLNRGEFSTGDLLIHTCTPEADVVVPRNLERLICATLGREETANYLHCCSKRRSYHLTEEMLEKLGKGLFAAVISDSRVETIIPGVWQTCSHVLSPYGALAYGSLQDYRSMTGDTHTALLIEERSPKRDSSFVCNLLRVNENDLRKILEL